MCDVGCSCSKIYTSAVLSSGRCVESRPVKSHHKSPVTKQCCLIFAVKTRGAHQLFLFWATFSVLNPVTGAHRQPRLQTHTREGYEAVKIKIHYVPTVVWCLLWDMLEATIINAEYQWDQQEMQSTDFSSESFYYVSNIYIYIAYIYCNY